MNKVKLGAIALFVVFVLGIAGLLLSLTTIKQGHVGVVYSRNGGVEENVLSEGMYFVSPMKKVTEYPTALETVEYGGIPLATKDGKPLSIDFSFNYMNDPKEVVNIFRKFKGASPTTIEETFLRSRLKENALQVTSKYTILDIFQNREAVKNEIDKKFVEDLKSHGFIVDSFVLGTPVPDESTAKAIQEVVNRQQELEALKIEKEKAKEIADKQVIEAKGKADAQIEEARGQAQANYEISKSITPNLIQMKEAEARSKHGWVTVSGNSTAVVKE